MERDHRRRRPPLAVKQRDQSDDAKYALCRRRLDQRENDTAEAQRGEHAARQIGPLAPYLGLTFRDFPESEQQHGQS